MPSQILITAITNVSSIMKVPRLPDVKAFFNLNIQLTYSTDWKSLLVSICARKPWFKISK